MDAFEFDYIDCHESPVGLVCLRHRLLPDASVGVVTEITVDNALLMSSHVTASEQALARRGIELSPGGELQVLVGGLGLGYTAHEALRSPRVARVEVLEYVPGVISWMERGLMPLSAELLADERLSVEPGDVYARLAAEPTTRYDVILVDVDHSPDERLGSESDAFYSEEGLRRAARHLVPGGVLGIWSYAESPAFEAVLRGVFDDVCVEPVAFTNRVFGDPETNWLYLGS